MILKNFYKIAFDFVNQNQDKIKDYAKQLKAAGGYNNFDIRLAFDCFYAHKNYITRQKRAAGLQDFYFSDYICDLCNINNTQLKDDYISTLYKKVLKDCAIL